MAHLTTPWLYCPQLRPASGGGVPPGVRWDYAEAPTMYGLANRPDLPMSTLRYGVIYTDRELTAEECAHFDLVAVA
jgi:hypothetical protein